MAEKYTSCSGTPTSYRKYSTDTDTITTFPKTIIGDGTAVSAYTVKGNMEQSGTPTPSAPIYPSECGERTENIFSVLNGMLDAANWEAVAYYGTKYFMYYELPQDYVKQLAAKAFLKTGGEHYNGEVVGFSQYKAGTLANNRRVIDNDGTLKNFTANFSTASNVYMVIGISTGITDSNKQTLINAFFNNYDLTVIEGSTAPTTYIPYGYQIPLTLGNTTTPIYLGEVQSNRQIKKLVLDGTENWTFSSGAFYTAVADMNSKGLRKTTFNCSHYEVIDDGRAFADVTNNSIYTGASASYGAYVYIFTDAYTTTTDFKAYLAQQYANGTPVTIWYPLKTETTSIVNEPLRKIDTYTDSVSGSGLPTSGQAESLDVGTTLKPSEVDLTYHGWHEKRDKVYTNGSWVENV